MMNTGLIRLIFLIVVGIIILGAFGINIRAVLMKETVKDNLLFVWELVRDAWDRYLAGPARYLWDIFYNLLWRSFLENAERIKEGKLPRMIDINRSKQPEF
jgi:hypothetical protein